MRIQNLFYDFVLNPVMRPLLRSPLHGVVSPTIAILRYRGRKSGRSFETPLSYVRDGEVVRFLSSRQTRWWLNFRGESAPVEVEIARRRHPGTARLLEGDSEALRHGVRQFLTALPRDARVYGIPLDGERRPLEPAIENAGSHVIVVEVELTGEPAGE